MTMQQIVDQLNIWAREYYVLDNPSVPDTQYDALYDQLVLLEKQTGIVLPDSPTHRVGGETLKSFAEHRHLKRLYSLDKAQSFGELKEWVDKVNRELGDVEFTVELKYDGLTINVTYRDGQLVSAATRGKGIVGEDVTEQVKTIRSVPLKIPFGVCPCWRNITRVIPTISSKTRVTPPREQFEISIPRSRPNVILTLYFTVTVMRKV